MSELVFFGRKLQGFCSTQFIFFLFQLHTFWIQLTYFITISIIGFLALKLSKPRTSFTPNNLDIFFTSVSATTVSSMSSVEMEVFSNTQFIILTVLMLLGGEVFTSMLGLQLVRTRLGFSKQNKITSSSDQIELGLNISTPNKNLEAFPSQKPRNSNMNDVSLTESRDVALKHDDSIRYLCYVVLGYLLVIHVGGSALVSTYVAMVPRIRKLLKDRGIPIQTFSVFLVVSTFANCGYVPINENMIVFKKDSGLLLLLIPLTLLGNTLYPVFLRILSLVIRKITKREEVGFILRNSGEVGYEHLLSGIWCFFLAATVLGFVLVQLVLYCSLEWNSEGMDGLNWYQKSVAALFLVVSSRHSGESPFDLSTISPAVLVVFVVMMHLPPYTSFLPNKYRSDNNSKQGSNQANHASIVENLKMSPLSYLVIFIILICITERQKLKEDPLNFNVLSITLEVISAYGNVGFSTGYSCERQLKQENLCKDKWFGLVGKWSNEGKWLLILVMVFGRLKKFSMNSGKSWILS